jgi:hypothetical protein
MVWRLLRERAQSGGNTRLGESRAFGSGRCPKSSTAGALAALRSQSAVTTILKAEYVFREVALDNRPRLFRAYASQSLLTHCAESAARRTQSANESSVRSEIATLIQCTSHCACAWQSSNGPCAVCIRTVTALSLRVHRSFVIRLSYERAHQTIG